MQCPTAAAYLAESYVHVQHLKCRNSATLRDFGHIYNRVITIRTTTNVYTTIALPEGDLIRVYFKLALRRMQDAMQCRTAAAYLPGSKVDVQHLKCWNSATLRDFGHIYNRVITIKNSTTVYTIKS